MTEWKRLIRFVSGDHTFYGDALSTSLKQARVIVGNPFEDGYVFGDVKPVHKLLSPIAPQDVKTVRLLGLNYRKHAAEAGVKPPERPIIFHKPATTIAGPTDPILVPPMAQIGSSVDYEVELVAVIGKQARNVRKENALEYVAGYTVGDDVSQRTWQMELGGGQWNFSKGFDTWAPIGPAIVRLSELPPPSGLRVTTKVNGVLRQSEVVSDMVFSVADAIEFLSAGQTLMPGDLLFMGTPSGVGLGSGEYLKNGDVVECSMTGVGTITNKVVYTGAKL